MKYINTLLLLLLLLFLPLPLPFEIEINNLEENRLIYNFQIHKSKTSTSRQCSMMYEYDILAGKPLYMSVCMCACVCVCVMSFELKDIIELNPKLREVGSLSSSVSFLA